jgi:hypothetical protein
MSAEVIDSLLSIAKSRLDEAIGAVGSDSRCIINGIEAAPPIAVAAPTTIVWIAIFPTRRQGLRIVRYLASKSKVFTKNRLISRMAPLRQSRYWVRTRIDSTHPDAVRCDQEDGAAPKGLIAPRALVVDPTQS